MATRQEELETQLDRLVAASAGCVEEEYLPKHFNKEKRKEAVEQVEQLTQAIHPFKLPAELKWFWTTWHAHFFYKIMGSPTFVSPKSALRTWEVRSADAIPGCHSLIQVAYEGHAFAAVELDYLETSRPLVWGGEYDHGGIRPLAPSLAVWVGARASVVESRQSVPGPTDRSWDDEEFTSLCQESLLAEGHNINQFIRQGTQDDWPQRWKTQQCLPKPPVPPAT